MRKRKDNKVTNTPNANANAIANKMIESAKEFEKSKIKGVKAMSRVAWTITALSMVMTALAICAVMLLTPLKTVEPYVVRVDNNTGHTDIVYALDEQKIDKKEAMDRYWLKNYVIFREGYDWYTVQANYDTTIVFSGEKEQKRIQQFFLSDVAPYKVFKNDFRVDVKITSISYVGDVAQVRFQRQMYDLRDPTKEPTTQKLIATIGYEYAKRKLSHDDSLINPLGFTVGSYTVDTEN
ncbi:virB8 family protein [Taylorella equigenitalis]|uniref:Inner membraney-like protein n=2 Tax=Taylorella equigenitalis TaxID=29575 RepID=A0A654KGW5_TAYEM|nr:type IV secretion system protein [Taylorella equigenitalis]ADU91096.1 Inner membraney-like protein [Taylorella equigenitalis MCE9]WDU45970.1 type IV secretion system protein [Taylorella equigenitalis]WDU48962.1 type IV secretion system protein [Taylorella equigenitalis]WDU51437.1 type IV secretion system protein [Taylorella equigenitalis]WDU55931.1 type IV secretion system protein [Taylorella equigenitalis]